MFKYFAITSQFLLVPLNELFLIFIGYLEIRVFSYYILKTSQDLIAGLTVGLTVIPQGLAYANLAELPSEYGLYSSFMGVFVYCLGFIIIRNFIMTDYLANQVLSINFQILIISEQAFQSLFLCSGPKMHSAFFLIEI